MPEKPCAATSRARSMAACGGQTERTTWLAATTGASPFMSSSPVAAARSRVWGLRPSEAQSTRRPFARAEAPTMLPMSPGCRRPIVELAMVRLSLGSLIGAHGESGVDPGKELYAITRRIAVHLDNGAGRHASFFLSRQISSEGHRRAHSGVT